MTETKDKIVVKYEQETNPVVDRAKTIDIVDAVTMKEATELLSVLNKKGDQIKEEKEKVLKPLREAAKAERERWKPVETVIDECVSRLRGLMSGYQTELARKAEEEKKRIAARVGEGKGKLKPETAIKKMGELDSVDEKVETEAGSVGFRAVPKLKITDEKKVPEKYWIIDEKRLFDDLKKGETIPGAEIKEIQIPINKR